MISSCAVVVNLWPEGTRATHPRINCAVRSVAIAMNSNEFVSCGRFTMSPSSTVARELGRASGAKTVRATRAHCRNMALVRAGLGPDEIAGNERQGSGKQDDDSLHVIRGRRSP